MQQTCRQCSAAFEITPDDLAFLEKVSPVFAGKKELIAPPTHCPDCRQQRRMAFRNQIHVYMRPSSTTGQPIFSMFDADAPISVMSNEEWHGDAWDPLSFGQEPDARPFFEQLRELTSRVPRFARSVTNVQNSDYANNDSGIKNCYFVFHTTIGEDGMYCERMNGSKDCIDCSYTQHSELCYDTVWCSNCYMLQSAAFCEGCSDSHFLRNCIGCTQCFGCVNLRHAQYCVFNEQYTQDQYENFLSTWNGTSRTERIRMVERFHSFAQKSPIPHMISTKSENGFGNFIQESRDVNRSFFITHAENVDACFSVDGAKDCRDYTTWGNGAELLWECAACGINVQRQAFCYESYNGNANLYYCQLCLGCSDCFGCVGLKKKRYCILNKQYSKEEYEALVPQIITHMRKTGEWGEFFPISLSAVAYNHTLAQRYYPLTKKQVEALGGRWIEETMPEAAQAIEASQLPNGLPKTDDPIIVKSERSSRPFKITSQEIKRYRQFHVPLPRLTYDERMEDRAKILGGITLFDRTCAKTGKPIKTTIPPESPWIVWDREVWEQEFRS